MTECYGSDDLHPASCHCFRPLALYQVESILLFSDSLSEVGVFEMFPLACQAGTIHLSPLTPELSILLSGVWFVRLHGQESGIEWWNAIFLFADAVADTFYSVGFVMSLCQLLSILELFHIADEIEKARLLPRFVQVCITAPPLDAISLWIMQMIKKMLKYIIKSSLSFWNCWWISWCMLPVFQVMEKNLLLTMVIILEEIQSKPVVCVQLFLWNIQDLLRYPYHLLFSSPKYSLFLPH